MCAHVWVCMLLRVSKKSEGQCNLPVLLLIPCLVIETGFLTKSAAHLIGWPNCQGDYGMSLPHFPALDFGPAVTGFFPGHRGSEHRSSCLHTEHFTTNPPKLPRPVFKFKLCMFFHPSMQEAKAGRS